MLLLSMAFAISALECKIFDGVEYVKIRGNFQPDGCPDGLQCLNNVCSTRESATDTKEGKSCSVRYFDSEYEYEEGRVVIIIDGQTMECGSGLKCLGSFAEDLYQDCIDDNIICTQDPLRGTCENPDTFTMHWGLWVLFVCVGIIVVVLVTIAFVNAMHRDEIMGS